MTCETPFHLLEILELEVKPGHPNDTKGFCIGEVETSPKVTVASCFRHPILLHLRVSGIGDDKLTMGEVVVVIKPAPFISAGFTTEGAGDDGGRDVGDGDGGRGGGGMMMEEGRRSENLSFLIS